MGSGREPNADSNSIARARFDLLCTKYGARARRFARLKLGAELRRRLDSEDLLQESLLEAANLFVRRPELLALDGEPFVRWLVEVIHKKTSNLARHHLAAERRSVRKEKPLNDASARTGSRTPSEIIVGAEDNAAVHRALSRLSPRQREVLQLVHFEGLKVGEAARRMGKTANATAVLHHEALVKLRTLLKNRKDGGS